MGLFGASVNIPLVGRLLGLHTGLKSDKEASPPLWALELSGYLAALQYYSGIIMYVAQLNAT